MYDFIKALVLPPPDLLLLLTAGAILVWRGRRRAGLTLVTIATVLFYLLSTPTVAAFLMHRVEAPPASDAALAGSGAQAIVILSGGFMTYAPEYGGGVVDAITLQRLRYGAHLARRLALPVLVTGGQLDDAPASLGAMMKAALEQDFGVDVRWVEDRAADTFENAAFSAAMLKQDDIHTIILVTHAAHMNRSARVFAAQGLTVVPAPTVFASTHPFDLSPKLSGLQESYYALYELLGSLWYGLRH